MARQFPAFGQVKNAIQEVGDFALQTAALGFGKPKTDPVDDREIRTDANGIIWQWDQAGNTWRFIGNSLQRSLGAPAMDFFYYGGSISFGTGTLTVAAVNGHHSWPESSEALLRLPSRFSAPQMVKTFNTGAVWASGANGNAYFDFGGTPLAGSTTDRVLSVILIRRESDGVVDYFVTQLDDIFAALYHTQFIANGELTINGTKWRACGVMGQLVWDSAAGRVLRSSQLGKTTYLEEEKARALALSAALTANFPATPYARCDFSIYCGPRVGGALGALRVANAATSTGRLIGFNPMQTATQAVSFNYTSTPNTNFSQSFSVAFNVSDFQVRLLGWTDETLPKLGF